jgi:hypothetical protein
MALIGTDVSEEYIAFIIRVERKHARNISNNSQLKHAAKKHSATSSVYVLSIM